MIEDLLDEPKWYWITTYGYFMSECELNKVALHMIWMEEAKYSFILMINALKWR
jgi:hypothetical protein